MIQFTENDKKKFGSYENFVRQNIASQLDQAQRVYEKAEKKLEAQKQRFTEDYMDTLLSYGIAKGEYEILDIVYSEVVIGADE